MISTDPVKHRVSKAETRQPHRKAARRELVLVFFLTKGNRPMNVTRLHSRLETMLEKDRWGIGSSDTKCRDARLSLASVIMSCKDWEKKGFLESTMITPARRKTQSTETRTPHYRLPVEDLGKRELVAKYLLERMPRMFVESEYGKEFTDEVALATVEVGLGVTIKPRDRAFVVNACLKMPRLLLRLMDDDFPRSLKRLDPKGKKSSLYSLKKYILCMKTVERVDNWDAPR